MCGIVGYVGGQRAAKVVLAGLQHMEYRGYDSSGLAMIGEDGLLLCKRAGKLARLEHALDEGAVEGGDIDGFDRAITGIGHTRWATHGAPTDENAHPHCSGRIALVHNGIIENYAA